MPIAHVGVNVADAQASKAFFLATLAPFGYTVFKEINNVVIGMAPKRGAPDFWIHETLKKDSGSGSTAVAKTHVAFEAPNRKTVDAFHRAALKAGAKCNGPPRERPHYVKGYYAAFVLDPDGNNIEAMYFAPLWLKALQAAPMMLSLAAVGLAWWVGKKGWVM